MKPALIAGNGMVWAPAIVALADTLCAYGVSTVWPEGASAFTTVELKCNFLGSLNAGAILGTAEMLHGGRRIQVWDAKIAREDTAKAARRLPLHIYPAQ